MKRFKNLILAGALVLGLAGFAVSCDKYGDDIDSLQTQVDAIKADLQALQAKVDAGKYVTNVSKSGDGIVITWNDNSTSTIETIKGDKGDAGAAGTVVTIVDGYWAFDGVKSEYPAVGPKGEQGEPGKDGVDGTNGADGHDVQVSEDGYWMVWDAEAGEYVKTAYIAGGVRAVETTGGYNLTVIDENGEEQTIFIPTSSTMGYIDVLDNPVAGYPGKDIPYVDAMHVLYGINANDVKYGPNKEKTLGKGLYVTLDRDLKIVVNPQGTDASAYEYSLLNSANQNTELRFKEAVPYKGAVLTRASSENGVWLLKHDFTRYEDINDARTKNYLLFKANDGAKHALSLTATLNNTTIKTPYDLGASLKKIGKVTVTVEDLWNCAVNEVYTPEYDAASVDANAVYDYWLTFKETGLNLKHVESYGAEIVDDGHAFTYTKEAGIDNDIVLVYNYILMDGTIGTAEFTAHMGEDKSSDKTLVLERLKTPFDAKLVTTANPLFTSLAKNKNGKEVRNEANGEKEFAMNTEKYSLADLFSEMSKAEQLLWKDAMDHNSIHAELIGGEGDNNAKNNNALNLRNIGYSYSAADNTIIFQFAVSKGYEDEQGIVENANFLLDNAYEVRLTALDEETGNPIASIVLPFELTQPTLKITPAKDGNFTQWLDINGEEVLLAYGAFDNYYTIHSPGFYEMKVPLYEAFDAWTTEYTKYKDEACYYKLYKLDNGGHLVDGITNIGEAYAVPLDNKLNYSATWKDWNTYTDHAHATTVGNDKNVEQTLLVGVQYAHYGVYERDLFTGGTKNQFVLTFASLLKNSILKMADGSETQVAEGKPDVFISNDDLDLETPMGDKFYLFDGLVGGLTVPRADLNKNSFNEDQRPFITVKDLFKTGADGVSAVVSAKENNGTKKYPVKVGTWNNGMWVIDPISGKRSYDLGTPATDITIFNVPAWPATQDPSHMWSAANVVEGYPGGMAIQLPTSIGDKEEIEITITLNDALGFTNELKFVTKKLQ